MISGAGNDASNHSGEEPVIRAKFLYRGRSENGDDLWLRQFPGRSGRWTNVQFILDRECRDYDWLVVYDDLPPAGTERFSAREEILACDPANTLLITSEPSTIKVYGRNYLKQFGHVLTTQEPWVIRHPGAIYSQCGYRWFYGIGPDYTRSWDEMEAHPPTAKTGLISTVCSTKKQKNTVHARRYAFTMKLKEVMPELELFGRGIRPLSDKAEALDSFRYHVVIENFQGRDHWSEKLADAFLGHTLPFYFGCPNVGDYFPADSLIAIDPFDEQRSIGVIRDAIASGEYERRLEAVSEARRRVLEEFNVFAVVAKIINGNNHSNGNTESPTGCRIRSRRSVRNSSPLVWVDYFRERYSVKLRHALGKGRVADPSHDTGGQK